MQEYLSPPHLVSQLKFKFAEGPGKAAKFQVIWPGKILDWI